MKDAVTFQMPQQIAICGAGVMGTGIATALLLHQFPVTLYDLSDAVLKRAQHQIARNLEKAVQKGKLAAELLHSVLQEKISFTTRLEDCAAADCVIEAIIEDRTAKIDLLHRLESLLPSRAIIATNTSSIAISSLQSELQHPGRFLGLHFFNPAHIMKLVEVVKGAFTLDSVIEIIKDFSESIGKIPVIVKDVPGFIVNRVARNFYNEALRIVEEGTASVEQVDRLLRSYGFRMGPFELMDLIGVDTNFAVTLSVWQQYFYDPRFAPSLLQKQLVDAKKWGRKTGEGFYRYSQQD